MLAYVTAFLDIYKDRTNLKSIETCIRHFETLAQTGVPIYLFLSKSFQPILEPILQKYPSIHLVKTIEIEELPYYTFLRTLQESEPIHLPAYGNSAKDTFEYILLQNSKFYFLKEVIQQSTTNPSPSHPSHYAWIDFSIFHIVQDIPHIQSQLQSYVDSPWPTPCLLFPGCHEKNKYPREFMLTQPCWRFCGGFFLGDADTIVQAEQTTFEHLQWFIQQYHIMPWEVNIWASMEVENIWEPTLYIANHNDSMLCIPQQPLPLPLPLPLPSI